MEVSSTLSTPHVAVAGIAPAGTANDTRIVGEAYAKRYSIWYTGRPIAVDPALNAEKADIAPPSPSTVTSTYGADAAADDVTRSNVSVRSLSVAGRPSSVIVTVVDGAKPPR